MMTATRSLHLSLLIVLCTFLCYASICNAIPNKNTEKLQMVYFWNFLDYVYPSQQAREQSLRSGEFVPGNPTPIDFEVDQSRGFTRVFTTMPRFVDGIPATLGVIGTQAGPSPAIIPYPNWEMNKLGSCDHITSVFRIKIDECGRLWVLDSGRVGTKRLCQPQLLVFDLNTDRLIHRYRIPESQLVNHSLLITLAVDIRNPQGQCQDTFVYLSDVQGFQIIVYDLRQQMSWNIRNNLFYPYPPYGTYTIAGESFDLMDGIFALALGPIRNGDRTLYFHSLASVVEGYVSTSLLRNQTLFKNNPDAAAREFKVFSEGRPSQSAAEVMDRNGVLYYGLLSETALGCWNSRDYPEFGGKNLEVLVVNEETLQFPAGIKIIPGMNGRDQLWVLSVAFQKGANGSRKMNEVNYRLQAAYVDELVRGTKCDVVSYNPHYVPSTAPSWNQVQPSRQWGR